MLRKSMLCLGVFLPVAICAACAVSSLIVAVNHQSPISINVTTNVLAIPAVANNKTVSVAASSARVAFASDRDRRFFFNIYTMNLDGTQVKRVTNSVSDDKFPAWSPDGQRIAFASDRDGNSEIYLVAADGSNVSRVTNSPAYDWQPAWSPDGRRLAFTSNREGNWEIYVANADGSGVARVTNNPAFDWQPSWSPEGNRIVFASDRDGNWEIYSTPASTTLVTSAGVQTGGAEVTRLTHETAQDWQPSWSPDGKQIAFVSTRDGRWEIYTMSAQGQGVQRITQNNAIKQFPAWSPDGRRILYESDSEIYSVNLDGSGLDNLTNAQGVNIQPACACFK